MCYYCNDKAKEIKPITIIYFSDSVQKVYKPLCEIHAESL